MRALGADFDNLFLFVKYLLFNKINNFIYKLFIIFN